MRAERLHIYVGEAGFFQTDVATCAAVDHAKIGQPDLLNSSLEVALQVSPHRYGCESCSDSRADSDATR